MAYAKVVLPAISPTVPLALEAVVMNNIYQSLLELLKTGGKGFLVTRQNGSEIRKELITKDELKKDGRDGHKIILTETFYPEPRLIILGGGHVALPLAQFGAMAGFEVTVVDDRPAFANSARFPEARRVICDSFKNCFPALNLNKSAFLVIVTRGHRYDHLCLRQALKYDLAFLGMIGSRRRAHIIKEQLGEEGYAEEDLVKINTPIGISIGAVTPEEVAVSILAQVISYRRQVDWPEFDRAVIEELAKDKMEPKGLVTVVSTKGSSPRKAGAKMIVWPDGRILGSIGGGCSEAEVIGAARGVALNGGHRFYKIDLTGAVAEDEGMVCGGIMEVFIERV